MTSVKAWMPLYGGDFLVATLGWDPAAVGHYIRLLLLQWDRGSLPDSVSDWEALSPGVSVWWDILAEKFPLVDGCRRNPRVEVERKRALGLATKRAEAGKRGAEARWGNSSETEEAATSPEIAAGHRDAKRVWECVPPIRREGFRGFQRLWATIVVRQKLDVAMVEDAFRRYYDSPKGKGDHPRGPKRLLEEAVWEDEATSWDDKSTGSRRKSMDVLEEILGGDL